MGPPVHLEMSNKPDAPNPAIASQLHSGRHWRGVGDPGRHKPAEHNRMSIADNTVEAEFPYARDDVFHAVCEAVPTVSGMSLNTSDKLSGHIVVKSGVSLFSWGETISISLIETAAGRTRVTITSAPKVGFGGGELDLGKNRRNAEELLQAVSRSLSARQPAQPPAKQPSTAAAPPPTDVERVPVYHVARNGKDLGEMPVSKIRKMVCAGALSKQDHYFDPQMDEWIQIEFLDGVS